MKSTEWNISVVQMDVVIGEPDKNYQRVEALVEEAMKGNERPDVIVLPEMWNAGYALTSIQVLADERGQRSKELLHRLSLKHQVNIVGGSVAVIENGQVRNVTYIYNRQGELVSEYTLICFDG
ncbi:nitrilase-related carbon-nitrogen hydrolase [Paenibacillus sp. 1001270B_150601_E10]|uniref:nitrilase-related carbon-nitrogen hydrolase n=1 Tax=Paenibacillus sp. 1001270B_150601_E10 TaxID=2787079 RepID=UPI002B4C1B15|nr:nitrilase-related carbon-nitrogen hydrolase [Paenibacillus sp. 1001270B_150601_E10]